MQKMAKVHEDVPMTEQKPPAILTCGSPPNQGAVTKTTLKATPDDAVTKKKEDEKEPTFFQRCVQVVATMCMSAEIPMALFFIAYGLFTPAQQHFIYRRICMYHFDSLAVCEQIDTSPSLKAEESVVQVDYATFSSYLQIASYAPVIVVALIYGTWCDRFTHRIPLALPHLGCAVVTVLYLLLSFLPNDAFNPTHLGWASFFIGIAGQTTCCAMAAFSYTARVSTPQNRTIRLAIMEACITLGETLGYIINAFLFDGGNDYYHAFLTQIAINLYSILYIIVMVPELICFKDVKIRVQKESGGSWFKYLFSPWENLWSAFKIIFGKHPYRTANERRWLILMLFTYTLAVVTVGSRVLQQPVYAYVTLQPISLSAFEYAMFQATWVGGLTFALFIIVPFLRSNLVPKLVPMSDAALGIIGILSRMIGLLVLAFGGLYPKVAPWAYCVVSMMCIVGFISIRSGMSKLTKDFEQGRVFGVNSLFESGSSLAVGYGFNALYGITVANTPSSDVLASFIHGYPILFDAFLGILPLITLIWLGMQPIKNWSFHFRTKETESEITAL